MLYFPCPGSPYFADPLGSSSYIVLATDYISSGLLCTCQELNVLSLFYVHRWISLFCPSIENSTSSPFSSPTSEFQLLVLSTHVLSLFFVRSQGLLFTPAAEAQGGPRPNKEGCSFILLFQFWPISDIFQLCHSHFSQMENVLLSTGLPFASDFASHLNKITQDDHCKYGNTSIAMEI